MIYCSLYIIGEVENDHVLVLLMLLSTFSLGSNDTGEGNAGEIPETAQTVSQEVYVCGKERHKLK